MVQKKNRRKIILTILSIGIVVFLITLFKRDASLKNNYIITTGRITKLQSGGTAGGLQFRFNEHNLKYDPIMGITWPSCRKLINKNISNLRKYEIPVVYSPNDLSNAEILIFEDQYKEFGIEIPNDIKEIVSELSKCKK